MTILAPDAPVPLTARAPEGRFAAVWSEFAESRLAVGGLAAVLDDGELRRQPDLGRRQSHAGGVAHGFAHQLDELLDLGGRNFGGRQCAANLAEELGCVFRLEIADRRTGKKSDTRT